MFPFRKNCLKDYVDRQYSRGIKYYEARLIKLGFTGKERVRAEFLELLPEAVAWVILGDLTIEDDVTADMIRAKVPEIVLTGTLTAPRGLIPTLQVLAVERTGEILESRGTRDEEPAEESPWSARN